MSTHYARISHSFPIPKLLSMRHCGIHISSDNHLTIIELAFDRGRLVPKAFERVSFPSPETDEGVGLRRVLASFARKYRLQFAKMSIPESKSYLFEVEIPKVSEEKMYDAVAFTIEEKAPVSLSEVQFGYKLIEEGEDTMIVSVGVVPMPVIDSSISLLQSAGMEVLSFKIEAQAVANAVIPMESRENAIVVSVKKNKTIIAIVQNGGVFMSTTVEWGGAIFDSILEKAGMTGDALRDAKWNTNYLSGERKDVASASISASFAEQATMLKNYINKHYVYWLTHKANQGDKSAKLDRIIVVGEDVCIPGLLEFLSGALSAKVEAGNVWTNCFELDSYVPKLPLHESFSYAEAIGLLIETV